MKLLVRLIHESKPIIAQVVKETGVLINVDRARSDAHEGEEALVDVPDESCILVSERMRSLGAEVRILEEGIRHDEEECVDCGACISICPKESSPLMKNGNYMLKRRDVSSVDGVLSVVPMQHYH